MWKLHSILAVPPTSTSSSAGMEISNLLAAAVGQNLLLEAGRMGNNGLSKHSQSPSPSPKNWGGVLCSTHCPSPAEVTARTPLPLCLQHPQSTHGLRPAILLPKRGRGMLCPHQLCPQDTIGRQHVPSHHGPGTARSLPKLCHPSRSPATKASIPAALPRLPLSAASLPAQLCPRTAPL